MRTLKIGKRLVGENHPCLVIAEIGSNHNHDLAMVMKMIDSAVQSGADVVKFQSFRADTLIVKKRKVHGKYERNSRWDLLHGLELPESWHKELFDYCSRKNIIFMSSPWDCAAVDMLESLGVQAYKIGSSDLTHHPLLRHIAATGKPILMSIGMATFEQIDEAIELIRSGGNDQIALLHCIVNYPPELDTVNLRYIQELRERYQCPIGYSDHNIENGPSIAAVALGASILEKHITVSREMDGPDHGHAITLDELDQLVADVRAVETALGTAAYQPGKAEFERIQRARRSAYASVDIEEGAEITMDVIQWLRPGGAIEPREEGRILGMRAARKIEKYKNITWDDLV